MPPKYRKLDYNKNKKGPKITHMLAVFVDHGIMAQPIKTLEFHYPMIQFLTRAIIPCSTNISNCTNQFSVLFLQKKIGKIYS